MRTEPTVHGGDLERVAAEFGTEPARLLDFSANVNPLGPPGAVREALARAIADPSLLMRYPDPHQVALRTELAGRCELGPDHIALGNGGAALIGAAVAALAARRCVLPVPAFSEYGRALQQHGVEPVPVSLAPGDAFALPVGTIVETAARCAAELCLVANPHNPSGALTPAPTMLALARELARIRCTLLVDEAFIDYAADASIASAVATQPQLVVVRSLTKFYAMPAIRIGYALASPPTARLVEGALPSWPFGTLAAVAARAALGDEAYVQRSLETNAAARAALQAGLETAGARAFPSAANFLLLDVGRFGVSAAELRAHLIRTAGIVVRSCGDYAVLRDGAYVRVAVRSPADNRRLSMAIAGAFR